MTDVSRVLRVAALHDLALDTPPGSAEGLAFAEAAAAYLTTGDGRYRAVIERLVDEVSGR